ncbi:ferredoxin [Kineosporia rhizophila]|uniref:ferredoxin n=1 Tax=Kineosporia TaxID=49184 RepID=UPI000B1D045E|nr:MULTISPECIES: ferredoxin [Kineosporia]MCE0536191.1 ferredoxin [Kineosporia rhizophila]
MPDIQADRDACVGAGQCAMIAPALFDQDDEGIVVTLAHRPPPEHESVARQAVRLCPARALALIEQG